MKTYTDIKEIYLLIEEGDTIGYYSNGARIESTLKEGIVSRIEPCNNSNGDYCGSSICKIRIYILNDEKAGNCHVYGGREGSYSIKYIKKEEFFEEKEFEI